MVRLKYIGKKYKVSLALPIGMKSKSGIQRVIHPDPYFELDEKNAEKLLAGEEACFAKHGHRNYMLAEDADAEEAAQKAYEQAKAQAKKKAKPAPVEADEEHHDDDHGNSHEPKKRGRPKKHHDDEAHD